MMLLLMTAAWPANLADSVAAGDCATVVRLTDAFDQQQEEWRVPRAWCLLKLGDAAGAAAMLSVEVPGVMGEYARLIKARALLVTGDTSGAEAALVGLSLPGAAGAEVRMTRARLATARGDLKTLTGLLSRLEPRAEAQTLYGEALLTAGEHTKAAEVFQGIWVAADLGGWDERAAERFPELGVQISAPQTAQRLKNLRKKGRIDEAAALAATSTSSKPVELAKVNLQARQYDTSLQHWKTALGVPAVATGSPELLFDYALTFARSGDYATAAVVYKRVISQHPTHARADFASYKLGYMSYDANECDAAVRQFAAHLKRYPSSKYLDDALWFTARCHWRAGHVDQAVASWTQLSESRPKSSLVPGAAYWRARAKGRQNDPEGERSGLERVLKNWPVSGYAWFAASRLGHTFPERAKVERPAWPEALAVRTDVRRAEALLSVGFRSWARDELTPVKKVLSGKDATLAGAWAFLAAGDYRTAQKLARPYCTSPWKGAGDPVAQQACTPRPEAGIVSEVAASFGLEPLLPFGIMTAESNLDPSVTSRAGARGLMQIMPAEGPRIHKELYPERPYDADDLYSAPYNASMGTAELGLKHRSLANTLSTTSLPAVIASYNGGEEAVRRWLKAYDGPPEFDEFSEDVGYTETRKYVKRVLGFVMAYRWTYGDPP